MRHLYALPWLCCLLLATGCGDSFERACQDNCEKRAECIGDITDVGQCQSACQTPALAEECLDAMTAYQRCLVEQTCEDYAASRGCDAELTAQGELCSG